MAGVPTTYTIGKVEEVNAKPPKYGFSKSETIRAYPQCQGRVMDDKSCCNIVTTWPYMFCDIHTEKYALQQIAVVAEHQEQVRREFGLSFIKPQTS